jgi:cobalt-zinc-cadmium efflux system outer membrane protein
LDRQKINLPLLGMFCVIGVACGCASQPPQDVVDRNAAAAGIREPIAFVTIGMPTDSADDEADAPTLRLDDAVHRSLRNDPGVQAALARTRAALADARQARLLPNPLISVALRFPEGGGGGAKPVIDAGLSADLASLLLRPRQVSAADGRLRAASFVALTTVLDVIAEVQDRYTAVQAMDAQLGNLDERMKLVRRLLDLARARMQAGESGRLDVITLDSERAALDVEITQTASERREARLALTRLLGQPSAAADWLLPPWSPPPPGMSLPESAWVATALQRRPEVQARRWELAALGDEAAIAGLGFLDGTEVGADAERDPDWTVGPAIAVPIPLLDWGQQRRAKAQAERIEARHKLTQVRRTVVEGVRRSIAALQASEAALTKARTVLIPLADQRRQQAEASYKSGFADITAVLLAEQDAQGAAAKLIELQQKVSAARFRLQRAAGGRVVIPGLAATTAPTTQASTEQP